MAFVSRIINQVAQPSFLLIKDTIDLVKGTINFLVEEKRVDYMLL